MGELTIKVGAEELAFRRFASCIKIWLPIIQHSSSHTIVQVTFAKSSYIYYIRNA